MSKRSALRVREDARMKYLKRVMDTMLIGGAVVVCVLAGYVGLRPDEVLEDKCTVQIVGGVEFTQCLTNGVARNTNTETVRIYIGMLYENNEKEMWIGAFRLGAKQEQLDTLFIQSDRYIIAVYDEADKKKLGSYSPVQNRFNNTERKIPL